MSGGQNRKPTVMKILEGTLRKDRTIPNEPKPEVVKIPPPMPEELDARGRKEWEKMTLELSKVGLLTTMDTSQLAAYCNEMGNYWESEIARRAACNIEDIKHYFDRAQKHLNQAKALAVQFGFTPSSRTRISGPKEEPEKPFADL